MSSTKLSDIFLFSIGICCKLVDGNYNGKSVRLNILYVLSEIYDTLLKCLKILFLKLILCYSTIVFESLNGSNDNNSIRMNARCTTLNIKELLLT